MRNPQDDKRSRLPPIGRLRFTRQPTKRIASSPSRSPLLSTAFLNPDGKVVTVVMNKTDQKFSYFLWLDGEAAEVESLPHSIQTLVF
jgi:glucosylceramidase